MGDKNPKNIKKMKKKTEKKVAASKPSTASKPE
jgi:hypothetical protein